MVRKNEDNVYDAVIIGGGPAGLTAAIYLARARYRVVVIEKEHFGGQITITSEVVNYPGIGRASGSQITDTMRRQAQSFGAEFMLAQVESIEAEGDIKTVRTGRGDISCFTILAATGAHPRIVGFEGEEEFRGHGVAYCATCDGEFFTGKDVFVIGGGFAAAEESVFLTKYARHVTVLIRGEDFTCAKATADAARNNSKITVLTGVQVDGVTGDSVLRTLEYHDRRTGEKTLYNADPDDTFGVFVFAGYEPATELLKGIAELDEQGYVITDKAQKTSADGVYAAGDVCVKPLRQMVTAAGDGAIAATEMEKYAAAMQERTGIRPKAPVTRLASEKKEAESRGKNERAGDSIFDEDTKAQLEGVFSRMESSIVLKICLDDRPVSAELEGYMEEMASMTDRITLLREAPAGSEEELPWVKICREDGKETGLAFHGAPGGHEFTSFILGIYNAAGPGQSLEEGLEKRIKAIDRKTDIKILVSLSCTMCPELVTAAQKIASMNHKVTAEVYDINHFGILKEKYNVMSVPCMVINGRDVTFGRKDIGQVLDTIEKA